MALACLTGCAIYANVPQRTEPPVVAAGFTQVSAGGRLIWVTCNPCSGPTPKEPVATNGREFSAGPSEPPLLASFAVITAATIAAEQPVRDETDAVGASNHVAAAIAPSVPESRPATAVEHNAVVTFRSDSHELDEHALDALAAVVRAARALRRVVLIGYTDDRGRKAYNDWLARARVEAVRDWLLDHGVPEDRFDADPAKSEGRCCYVATNATAAGRARNRRVAVTLLVADADGREAMTHTGVARRD